MRFANRWFILSAKYGFIPPDFPIPGNYNVSFKCKSNELVTLSKLQEQIRNYELHKFHTIIALGGKDYRVIIEQAFAPFGKNVHFPFAGASQGDAMHLINDAVRAGDPKIGQIS